MRQWVAEGEASLRAAEEAYARKRDQLANARLWKRQNKQLRAAVAAQGDGLTPEEVTEGKRTGVSVFFWVSLSCVI